MPTTPTKQRARYSNGVVNNNPNQSNQNTAHRSQTRSRTRAAPGMLTSFNPQEMLQVHGGGGMISGSGGVVNNNNNNTASAVHSNSANVNK